MKPQESSTAPLLPSVRHEQGRNAVAGLVNYWLTRSKLSHDQFSAIASWALGERGLIDTTTLSRLPNNRQPRGASYKNLDAFAAANELIWCWQTQGQADCLKLYGTFSGWGVVEDWLADAIWLPRPDDETKPLRFAEFAEVMVGRLVLPYLGDAELSPADVTRMNDALLELLERLCVERKLGSIRGPQQLMEAYPATDRARRMRFRALIGGERLNAGELELELHALAETVRTVRGLKEGEYGAPELMAELRAARHHPNG